MEFPAHMTLPCYQKLTYKLNVPHPIPIHPTPTLTSSTPGFTIARFKSASTRLYSTARAGPWERLGVGLGGVVMWDNIGWTLKWMGVRTISVGQADLDTDPDPLPTRLDLPYLDVDVDLFAFFDRSPPVHLAQTQILA